MPPFINDNSWLAHPHTPRVNRLCRLSADRWLSVIFLFLHLVLPLIFFVFFLSAQERKVVLRAQRERPAGI